MGNFMPLFSTATSPPTASAGGTAALAPDSAATLLWSTWRRPRSVVSVVVPVGGLKMEISPWLKPVKNYN